MQCPEPGPSSALALALLLGACASAPAGAPTVEFATLEAELVDFLGEPRVDTRQLFSNERFPNVVVTLEGTVVVTWGSPHVRSRRSVDGGASWEDEVAIGAGIQGGGTLVDERSGDLLAFVEDSHPPAPLSMYRSVDDGRSWRRDETTVRGDLHGNVPSMHMNEAGITLRRGEHAGRLVRAARWYAAGNRGEEWPNHYTTAVYSDDGGRTWSTSDPFPENGTGEAVITELSDGRLYYNSRVHWQEAEQHTRRRCAYSDDAGASWKDWRVVEVLPDGRQDRSYGCMGGLVRLPVVGRDVLLFSNLDTPRDKRERITVWASFDGGVTWPIKRLVWGGPSAYSSMSAGRPGSASAGWIYLHHEGGPAGGSQLARFNLTWLLEGEPTGDGELPGFVQTGE